MPDVLTKVLKHETLKYESKLDIGEKGKGKNKNVDGKAVPPPDKLSISKAAGGVTKSGSGPPLAVLNPPPPPPPPPSIVGATPPAKAASVEERRRKVLVHYATERKPTGEADPRGFFGTEQANDPSMLNYGTVTVSIPPGHKPGEIERPFEFLVISLPENADRHFVLERPGPMSKDDFFTSLRVAVERRASKSAFVFVHGFNVRFDEAAWRAAQIAFDLGRTRSVDLAPILFSWASLENPLQYNGDQNRVRRAQPRLEAFLKEVRDRTGATTIHVVAHSMGARLVSESLAALVREGQDLSRFGNVVLGAADIDAKVFRDQIAPLLAMTPAVVTLYVSASDKTMAISQWVSDQESRIGDARVKVSLPASIDVIDGTVQNMSWLGHSYLFESPSLLDDLFKLINERKRAADRGLARVPGGYFTVTARER